MQTCCPLLRVCVSRETTHMRRFILSIFFLYFLQFTFTLPTGMGIFFYYRGRREATHWVC